MRQELGKLRTADIPDEPGDPQFDAQLHVAKGKVAQRRANTLARIEAAAAINEVDDPEVLRRMADTALTTNDLHGDPRMGRLRHAVGGDLDALHAVIAETAAEMGLTRIGGDPKLGPDQLVTFDRKLHDSIGGSLRPGQKVLLVSPGYTTTGPDGAVLFKAKVEEADPDEIRRLTRP